MTHFLGERICPRCPDALIENDTCPICGYVYRRKVDDPIEQACIDLIEGAGGLDDYEEYEIAVMNCRREIGVVMWTVRCIGNNPNSELAKAIRERWESKTQ